MPLSILDLVGALARAQAGDETALQRFRTTHGGVLSTLWRQRAPWDPDPPTLPVVGRETLARAHAGALRARVQGVAHAAALHGLGHDQAEVVLFLGLGRGDVVDAIPHPVRPQLVLALDHLDTDLALDVALARGLALLARWAVQRLPTPIPWDRLAVLAQVPLAEWVYAEGLAHHLVASLHPDIAPHRRMGLARGTWDLLRRRESALLDDLDADLPRAGMGPWARWMDPAPPVPERSDSGCPPRAAIAYLSWRLLEERVRRVGLAETAAMPA